MRRGWDERDERDERRETERGYMGGTGVAFVASSVSCTTIIPVPTTTGSRIKSQGWPIFAFTFTFTFTFTFILFTPVKRVPAPAQKQAS